MPKTENPQVAPINKEDLYLTAGARENTRKSYRSAIHHL